MDLPTLVLFQLLNGLVWGLVIALIALGLALIFGIMEVINVAHGSLYMLGAVLAWYVLGATGSFALAVLAAPFAVGVTLDVREGEIAVLVGRNGVGKTTTLDAILGLVDVTGGEVRFEGQRVSGLPPHEIPRRGIGYVPQGRRIFPELTVRENLEIGCVRGALDRQVLARVFGYFPRLEERLWQPGGTLSGGEQQMLAIGRALLGKPRLLLLGEPTED